MLPSALNNSSWIQIILLEQHELRVCRWQFNYEFIINTVYVTRFSCQYVFVFFFRSARTSYTWTERYSVNCNFIKCCIFSWARSSYNLYASENTSRFNRDFSLFYIRPGLMRNVLSYPTWQRYFFVHGALEMLNNNMLDVFVIFIWAYQYYHHYKVFDLIQMCPRRLEITLVA